MARRFDRLGWAMDQDDLTPPQRFVLLILADMANEQGECWPSKTTIAARTGYGTTAVKDALRVLRTEEVLVVRPRFAENGRQTSNMYVLCLEGRGRVATPPVEDVDDDHESGREAPDDPSPVASRPHVEPTTRTTTRKKDNQTSSGGPSSRRAARERVEAEWVDPAAAIFAKEQEQEQESAVLPRLRQAPRSPDSAWGLNGYYREQVFLAGSGRVGNTNDGAMRKFFAEAKRVGVPAAVLRDMVDAFVSDTHLFNKTRTHRWKVFIANAPLLQDRAENVATYRRGGQEQEVRVPSRGAIPQRILDKILAEAG